MAKRVGIAMQKGFSLIEVMIALAIFSFFATAMLGELSYNVSSSMQMAKDLDLHNLAEMKMSEVLIGKKEFTNATEMTLTPENLNLKVMKPISIKLR